MPTSRTATSKKQTTKKTTTKPTIKTTRKPPVKKKTIQAKKQTPKKPASKKPLAKKATTKTTTKKPPAKKPVKEKLVVKKANIKKPKIPPLPKDKQIVPFVAVSSKKLKPMSETDLKYIKIITWLADNPGKTNEDAMKHFKCSKPTVTRAKTRGRLWGQFESQAADLLKMTLTKLVKFEESLLDQYNHVATYNDNQAAAGLPGNPSGISNVGNLILSVFMKIGEMQGIYSTKVRISLDDESALKKLTEKFDSIDFEAIGKGVIDE